MKPGDTLSFIRIALLAFALLGWLLFAALSWFSWDRIANRVNTHLGKTAGEQPWMPKVEQARRQLAEEPWLDPRKPVVLIGDSHLELCQWYQLSRGALPIRNLGVSMSRIGDAELVARSLQPSRASSAVIMCGINDLGGGATDRQMLRDYENLFDTLQIRAPGVPILVLSLMPVGTDPNESKTVETNRRISILNPLIRAEAESRNFHFLDLTDLVGKQGHLNPSLTYDGLHLNRNGYRKIFPAIFESIAPLIEAK